MAYQNNPNLRWDTGGTRLLITPIAVVRTGKMRRLPPHGAPENPGKSHRPEDLDTAHFFLYYLGWKRSLVQVRMARPITALDAGFHLLI